MISNTLTNFKFTFDATVTHDMTTPLICNLICNANRTGYPKFSAHLFHDVVCSVTVWDHSGGYWWVEGDTDDQGSGHGNSDYEYDIQISEPGIIHVYTDAPEGVIMINGVELTQMGPAESGA